MDSLREIMRTRVVWVLGGLIIILASWWSVSSIEATVEEDCDVTLTPEDPLQAAIIEALPESVICLTEGVWRENIVIRKSLKLRGAGSEKTVIYSARENRAVVQITGGVDVTLRELTLTGAVGFVRLPAQPHESPHGLLVRESAQVMLQGVYITNNGAGNYGGHGVFIYGNAVVLISRSVISRNRGEGIAVAERARVIVNDSIVSQNGFNGIFVRTQAQVIVQGSSIMKNEVNGLWVGDSASVQLIGNAFEGNKGYGFAAAQPDNMEVCRENTFSQNGKGPYNSAAAEKCQKS